MTIRKNDLSAFQFMMTLATCQKAAKAACEEAEATAEGGLAVTEKDLANAEQALAVAQQSCMQVAADHEASMKSRGEELAALAQVKKVLKDTTGGAVWQTYSLLQVASGSRVTSRADLANAEVVSLIKRLAQHAMVRQAATTPSPRSRA